MHGSASARPSSTHITPLPGARRPLARRDNLSIAFEKYCIDAIQSKLEDDDEKDLNVVAGV